MTLLEPARAEIDYYGREDPLRDFQISLAEVLNNPDSGVPVRSGEATAIFKAIDEETREALDRVKPGLPWELMYPESYQSDEARDGFRQLRREFMQTIGHDPEGRVFAVRHARLAQLEEAAMTLARESTEIRPLMLADTPYVDMAGNGRSCALANFLMMYNGIADTDLRVNETAGVLRAAYTEYIAGQLEDPEDLAGYFSAQTRTFNAAVNAEWAISDHQLLSMFKTAAFAKANRGVEVLPIEFAGFTIKDLQNVITKIKHARPESEVRATITIQSEGASRGILHQLALVEIDKNCIVAHDPASYGRSNKAFPARTLLKRWYQAQGRGYLTVTQRTQVDNSSNGQTAVSSAV